MLEDRLAAELQRRQLTQEREKREIQRICAESEELRELKQKLMTAYTNKERSAQLQEQQTRKVNETIDDAYLEKEVLRKAERQLKAQALTEDIKRQQRLHSKEVLQHQILEREQLREEAYQEYLREKQQVDRLINQMVLEDQDSLRKQGAKKQQAINDIHETLQLRHAQQQQDRERAAAETEALQRYQEEQERRDRELAALRAKKEEERGLIFEKLEAEEQRRRAEADYLDRLRTDLYYEELENNARTKELQTQEKLKTQKEELMRANAEQRDLKERRRLGELGLEEQFKQEMLRKFAEDDRLEQMNAQKRRMRELEHKRQADVLWRQKQELLREQWRVEEEESERVQNEERRRRDIIEIERQRLLQEFAPHVADYLPKGTFKTGEEFKYLPRKP